jgi:hypothetical protein
MANRLYNKQVTPKGYKKGGSVRDTRKTEQMIGASISSKREKGRTKKMFGGMMKRPMMKKGGVTSEAKKKQFKTNQAKQKETTKKVLKAIVGPFNPVSAGQNVAKKIKERMGKKMGGSLKPVNPKTQKGLSKLPTEVRNKMGFMKKGGVVSDAKKKQFKENKAGQKSFNKKAIKVAKTIGKIIYPQYAAGDVASIVKKKIKGAK